MTPPIAILNAIGAAGSAAGAVRVPLRSGLPFFDVQAVLDGAVYTLRLRWNTRAERWALDILDGEGVTVYESGIRLVVSFPLAAYTTARKPPGALVAIDTSGQSIDPGLDDLGDGARVQLYYFDEATIAGS